MLQEESERSQDTGNKGDIEIGKIMINANNLREQKYEDFKANFDFATFDAYIEEHLKKQTYIEIGVDYPQHFKGDVYKVNIGTSKNYIWTTGIQVCTEVYKEVWRYLINCGFKLSAKAACGYEEPDVIVVKL